MNFHEVTQLDVTLRAAQEHANDLILLAKQLNDIKFALDASQTLLARLTTHHMHYKYQLNKTREGLHAVSKNE